MVPGDEPDSAHERQTEMQPDCLGNRNEDNRDKQCNHAVFNGGCPGLILQNPGKCLCHAA